MRVAPRWEDAPCGGEWYPPGETLLSGSACRSFASMHRDSAWFATANHRSTKGASIHTCMPSLAAYGLGWVGVENLFCLSSRRRKSHDTEVRRYWELQVEWPQRLQLKQAWQIWAVTRGKCDGGIVGLPRSVVARYRICRGLRKAAGDSTGVCCGCSTAVRVCVGPEQGVPLKPQHRQRYDETHLPRLWAAMRNVRLLTNLTISEVHRMHACFVCRSYLHLGCFSLSLSE